MQKTYKKLRGNAGSLGPWVVSVDIEIYCDRYFKELKQMCMKFTKGAMQAPFGDIGRHGDSKTNIFKNLTKGSMQGPSETTLVIQVDIRTLKL